MKVLVAAYYEFLKNIRDVKMIVILIVLPIITTYILGSTIGSFFSTDMAPKISIGYVNQDIGSTGKQFDQFLENKEIRNHLNVIGFSDKDTGQKAIDEGRIDAMIYLQKDLSESILKGDKAPILLYGKKNVEFVESLTRGFVSSYNTLNAVISVSGEHSLPTDGSSIRRISYTKKDKLPEMIDYYSVLTLLQMLIIGAIFGVFIITKLDNSDMHIRLYTLPVSRWTIIVGRILGSIAYVFLAAVVIMLFTKFAYHANWNGNPFIILGTLLVFCAMAVGMGVLIGIFVPSFSTAIMIIMLLSTLFSTLSGGVSPKSTGEAFSILSPNFHAKILIFGTIYGYSMQIMQEAALWLMGYTIAIYGVSAVFLRRRNHDHI